MSPNSTPPASRNRRFASSDAPSEWHDVVQRALTDAMGLSDVAELARRLAGSGEQMGPRARRTADLASTGGPTSLTTLICPAILSAGGWEVPKLGVPGRPAGGVDVLAGLKGYDVSLDAEAAERVLDACGYVHLDAGARFAPADAELFRYRQKVGAQSVRDLAIASLLSKKLAMGVRRVGLEIRVAPHGNFGADRVSARAAADRFCKVARILHFDPVCILTDATQPFQPYVGRGEALLALRILLDGEEGPWLGTHLADCVRMAATVASSAWPTFDRQGFSKALLANIVAQGGAESFLRHRADEVEAGQVYVLSATSAGVPEYNLGLVRTAVMAAQGSHLVNWPDNAGVVLHAQPNTFVDIGETLLTARCPPSAWPNMRDTLAGAIRIVQREEAPSRVILEVVGV